MSPFSETSRKEILQNSNNTCECGKSSRQGWRLQASHINHDKKSPDYDNPENGKCHCVGCHLDYHISLYNRALNGDENINIHWAIASLKLLANNINKFGYRERWVYEQNGWDIFLNDKADLIRDLEARNINPNDVLTMEQT
jgi:hypothetical protein